MYLYKKKNGKKFDLKIARYRGLPYSGWTYQSETTLLSSCLNSPLRISKVPGSVNRTRFLIAHLNAMISEIIRRCSIDN